MYLKLDVHIHMTPQIDQALKNLDVLSQTIKDLKFTPTQIGFKRDMLKVWPAFYGTRFEKNRLSPDEVYEIIENDASFSARTKDKKQILGYTGALEKIEDGLSRQVPLNETLMHTLHAEALSDGFKKIKELKPFQTSVSKYAPDIFKCFERWMSQNKELPPVIMAGVFHYLVAFLRPFKEANERLSFLTTRYLLRSAGYSDFELCFLEGYFGQNLQDMLKAIAVKTEFDTDLEIIHADLSSWIAFFINGIVKGMEETLYQLTLMENARLSWTQRCVYPLFINARFATTLQIGVFLGIRPTQAAEICREWCGEGFLEPLDTLMKSRRFRLA